MSDEYTIVFTPDPLYQEASGEYERVLKSKEPYCKECYCPACKGQATVKGETCKHCNGFGKLENYHPNPHLRERALQEFLRSCGWLPSPFWRAR